MGFRQSPIFLMESVAQAEAKLADIIKKYPQSPNPKFVWAKAFDAAGLAKADFDSAWNSDKAGLTAKFRAARQAGQNQPPPPNNQQNPPPNNQNQNQPPPPNNQQNQQQPSASPTSAAIKALGRALTGGRIRYKPSGTGISDVTLRHITVHGIHVKPGADEFEMSWDISGSITGSRDEAERKARELGGLISAFRDKITK